MSSQTTKLNPKAKPFVFNPNTPAFVPKAQPKPTATDQPSLQEPSPSLSPSLSPPPQEEPVKSSWDEEEIALAPGGMPTSNPKAVVNDTEKVEKSEKMEKTEKTEKVEKIEKIEKDEKPEKRSKEKPQKEKTEKISKAKEKLLKEQKEYKVHDEREHLNIVFIGHVDSGKSTISGQILLQTGQVDERTIQKYEKEAKEKNRDSWYIAYIMDTSDEERAKGKTVEVGRAHFTTHSKRFTLLDAPGHKSYVPNMIGGAAQADVGVLVISARKGEFETGFDRGGQTREHAMLAKTLGISKLFVLVNKMDDPTVVWNKARYDEIEAKLSPFLKKWGYNVKQDVIYCPISGLTGLNMKDPVPPSICPWWEPRVSFLQLLDKLKPLDRPNEASVRIPIITKYKEMGSLFVLGKLESGTLYKGAKLLMQPNSVEVDVLSILVDEQEVNVAKTGENLVLKLKGIEEEDVHVGFVLSPVENPAKKTTSFDAQIAVLDLLDHKPLITAGYNCVLHIHSLSIECQIAKLVEEFDSKTNKALKKKPRFLKSGAMAIIKVKVEETIVVELFKEFPQLGRFTLRDEGRTIAIGKVMKIKEFVKNSSASSNGTVSKEEGEEGGDHEEENDTSSTKSGDKEQ